MDHKQLPYLPKEILDLINDKRFNEIQQADFLDPSSIENLINKIIDLCNYKVVDKETRNIKLKKLFNVFKDKLLISHGYELTTEGITNPNNNDMLTWSLREIFRYVTPEKTRHFLLYLFSKIDFKEPIIYDRLRTLYQELGLRDMPRIEHSEMLLTNYVMRDILGDDEFIIDDYKLYYICTFLQYINNNYKQFDEEDIDKFIIYVIKNKMNKVCSKILKELKTMLSNNH